MVSKIITYALAASCVSCYCRHRTQSNEYSPSRQKIAKVIVNDCGALSGEDTVVTISNARGFFAKSNVVIVVNDNVSIGIAWANDHALTVYIPKSAVGPDFANQKISVQKSNVDGVDIDYRML
jgi:hypothetical protein